MDNDQPTYMGYVYALGFFVALMVMTTCENAYFDTCIKVGVRIRSSLVPSIYRHALRMSNQARQDRCVGAIVNHMAADTEKIVLFCQSVNNLWSAPVRLALGLYLLISALGPAGVFGIISVLLITPIQTYVMKQFGLLFKEVMKKSDARIKILNEVLSGMRVIKYYAWELPFENKIESLRADELIQLKSSQRLRALNLFFMNLNPVALSVGTFVAFAVMQGNISASQAFQALALFQQLLWPLLLFPSTLSQLTEVNVAITRIEEYLLSSVIEDPSLTTNVGQMGDDGFPYTMTSGYLRICDAKPEINIDHGYYSWQESISPSLSDVSIRVTGNELVAIVGHTGSGKSSLASAIIGEMYMASGRAITCGSIAYVPQQAWIFNATVRENILFGLPFDAARYQKAIEVSCLKKDIECQFDAGDQTEIGEKGINLSGGQRQRVSIARAVYANADLYVFDDPLSALDAHVTSDLFKACIRGHLSNKVRILVTNQLHLMPEVDRIIVLKQGKIVESGSFNQLMSLFNGEFHRLYSDFSATGLDVDMPSQNDLL
jgi:ATP-binding cassette subfamily C (CFTR/MRP) protein 1